MGEEIGEYIGASNQASGGWCLILGRIPKTNNKKGSIFSWTVFKVLDQC